MFETWKTSTGKHKAQLDPRRRRKITDALKKFPLDDVLAAVQGWKADPFYAGDNDRGRVYNDLELLLRDTPHIEQFRDLYHGDGFAPGGLSRSERQRRQTSESLQAWAAEVDGHAAG